MNRITHLSFTWVALFLCLAFSASSSSAKTVRYELTATRGSVNLSGKASSDFALMINGSIPAPTLEFNEGDIAEIVVKNGIPDEELSLHWHGLLVPPEMDGVAYVTTPPIFPGQSLTFRFPLRQSGTYWYHSHTHVQEQKGLYGALVIHPKKDAFRPSHEKIVVLSDWSDENADQILRNLRKDGNYYLYKKDTIRSWWGAFRARGLGVFLENEWTRMGGMDYSDVGYDAFLINGKRELKLLDARPGETVRLRIINAAASTYFYVSLGQSPMKVISADGIDIRPTLANELLMGMAETYDVLFRVPDQGSTELRVTPQDGTGSASGWIGLGTQIKAPARPAPDLYAPMMHSMHHATPGMDHSQMDHSMMDHSEMSETSQAIQTLTVDDLEAQASTEFAKNAAVRELKLTLGGDMDRYVWHINGKAIHEDRNIEVKEGEVVRFVFVNETMMHHPMHLHGHFFRVLNKNGARSPLKHTVDVPPHGSRTIEFLANEPGEWMLHCHNLFHMKTGMARVVKYMSFTPSPHISEHLGHDPHLHEHLYFSGQVELATNQFQERFRLSRTWDEASLRIESRKKEPYSLNKWEYESAEGDLFYRRWFGNFLSGLIGGTAFHDHYRATAGVSYLLPMLIRSTLLIDHKGKFRLDLEKRFQWTTRILTDADVTFRQNESPEYKISLLYQPAWAWAAGLSFTDEAVGITGQFQF